MGPSALSATSQHEGAASASPTAVHPPLRWQTPPALTLPPLPAEDSHAEASPPGRRRGAPDTPPAAPWALSPPAPTGGSDHLSLRTTTAPSARARPRDSAGAKRSPAGAKRPRDGLLLLVQAAKEAESRAGTAAAAQASRAAKRAAAAASAAAACLAELTPRVDAYCPYSPGSLKAVVWAALAAAPGGLTTAALCACVPGGVERHMMTAVLTQEALNVGRIAPNTYALRPAPAGAPAAVAVAVDSAALAALSLPALRAMFQAAVGRPTASKNKGWLVARLKEREGQ